MPLFFPKPINLAGLFFIRSIFDYVSVHRAQGIFTVHGSKCCSTAIKYFLDHTWPFVYGSPFPPTINLVHMMFEVIDQPLITRFLIVLTFLSIFLRNVT